VTTQNQTIPVARCHFIFIFNTFFKLFLILTLFFFFKSNTFGHAYFQSAEKELCRAMHGGAAGVRTWQRLAPLVVDMARLAAPPIRARL